MGVCDVVGSSLQGSLGTVPLMHHEPPELGWRQCPPKVFDYSSFAFSLDLSLKVPQTQRVQDLLVAFPMIP